MPSPAKPVKMRSEHRLLRIQIKNRFNVAISERSVGRILRAQGFRRLSVRPQHPKADEALQQTSATTFPPYYGNFYRTTPRQNPSKSGSKMKLV